MPQLCPSPVSHLPASAIKVRQSSTLASLYLWHYASPRPLTLLCRPPLFHPFRLFNLKAPVTHLSFLSSTPVVLKLLAPGLGEGGKGTIGAKMVTTLS